MPASVAECSKQISRWHVFQEFRLGTPVKAEARVPFAALKRVVDCASFETGADDKVRPLLEHTGQQQYTPCREGRLLLIATRAWRDPALSSWCRRGVQKTQTALVGTIGGQGGGVAVWRVWKTPMACAAFRENPKGVPFFDKPLNGCT